MNMPAPARRRRLRFVVARENPISLHFMGREDRTRGAAVDNPTYAERDQILRAMTLLGLSDGFTEKDLDAAYHAKVTKYHPDRATSDDDLARRTRVVTRLNAARDLLRHHVGFRREAVPDVERLGERLVAFAIVTAVVLQILQVFFLGIP